jgi:hypothetical protein
LYTNIYLKSNTCLKPTKYNYSLGAYMSWFKRRPHIKEPEKLHPQRTSPVTEQAQEKAKETGPTKKTKPKKEK